MRLFPYYNIIVNFIDKFERLIFFTISYKIKFRFAIILRRYFAV